MRTIPCKSCKEQINEAEKTCPKCGFPNKQNNLLSTLVRIVITFGILGYFFGEDALNWVKSLF